MLFGRALSIQNGDEDYRQIEGAKPNTHHSIAEEPEHALHIYSHSRILWDFPRSETRGSLLKSEPSYRANGKRPVQAASIFSQPLGWWPGRGHPSNVNWRNDSAQSHKDSFFFFCMAGLRATPAENGPGIHTKTKPFYTKRFCLPAPAAKMMFFFAPSHSPYHSLSVSLFHLFLFLFFSCIGRSALTAIDSTVWHIYFTKSSNQQ